MFKSFVKTPDGDEIMVEFDTEREQTVFEEVKEAIIYEAGKLDSTDPPDFGPRNYRTRKFSFNTTLEGQVASNYLHILRKVVKVHVLNVGEGGVVMSKYIDMTKS